MVDLAHLSAWLMDRYCWHPLGVEQICGVSRTDHESFWDDEHDFIPFKDALKKYAVATEGVIHSPPTVRITG